MPTQNLQHHFDAHSILINLILTSLGTSNPNALRQVLQGIRYTIDSTPQLAPECRELLEIRYMTFFEMLNGIGRV